MVVHSRNVRRFKKIVKTMFAILQKCVQIVSNVHEFKKYLKICKSVHEFEKCSLFQICSRV